MRPELSSLAGMAVLFCSAATFAQDKCSPYMLLKLRGRVVPRSEGGSLSAELRARGRNLEGVSVEREESIAVRCDPRGEFHVNEVTWKTGPEVLHTLILWTEENGRSPRTLAARFDWLGDLEDGIENDLGVQRLTAPPLVVAGCVRAADGHGPGASIRVERAWTDHDGGLRWWNLPSLDTGTAEDGTFEIRGYLPEGVQDLRLKPGHPELEAPERVVSVGTGGVVLQMQCPTRAAIRGSAWLEPELERYVELELQGPRHLLLSLCRPVPTDAPPKDGDHVFHAEQLLPGEYRLGLHVRGEEEQALELGRVTLAADEKRELAALDLRGRVRLLHFTLLDEARQSISSFRICHRRPGEMEWQEGLEGEGVLATSAASMELLVDSPGFRRLHLAGVETDRTIVMRPAYSVEIAFENLPIQLALDASFDVDLCQMDQPAGTAWIDCGHGDVNGVAARLQVTATGPHGLWLTMHDRRDCKHEAAKGIALPLEVFDVDGPQVFSVRLSQFELVTLAARWRGEE